MALVAVLSPPASGLALAIHLLGDHDHAGGSPPVAVAEVVVHGHAHVEGTPAHGHPVLGSAAGPLPPRGWMPLAESFGGAAEVADGDPLGRRGLSWDRPADDPPPRRAAPPILRI